MVSSMRSRGDARTEVRKNHTVEAIVDKLVIRPGVEGRLSESMNVALRLADGLVSASYAEPGQSNWSENCSAPSMHVRTAA